MHSIATPKYNFSFTAASLRPELARIVADHFLTSGDWETTRRRVLATNALQCRSAASSTRLEGELRKRLQTLTTPELLILARSTEDDRAAIAWLAAMKHSQMLYDFAAEVLRDKLLAHDPVLRPSDYESFVESKSATQPGLTDLAPTSKSKIRQVLLRMLTEAGILSEGEGMGVIQRPVLSPDMFRIIAEDSPRWLAGFLVPDAEIPSHIPA